TRVLIRRVFVALVVATIFLGGIQLRRWVGENTRHVRYQHDIVNGFYWGNEILKEARQLSPDEATANSWSGFFRGYLALYDRVKEDAYENDYHLDYPPLRLLVMAIWAKQVRNGLPVIDDGHPKLVNPLLKINLLCELLSAVAIFCLVHLCVQRSRPTRSSVLHALPQQHRAWICGLAAARSEEHTSELQSLAYLVCRLLLEKNKEVQTTRRGALHHGKRRSPRRRIARVRSRVHACIN